MTKIAVFSSGQGSTLNHLIQHFNVQNTSCKIELLITDRTKIKAIDVATQSSIPAVVANKKDFINNDELQKFILSQLQKYEIQFIVLAGYLKKISDTIINEFENKIINTHPSLLPKYGGKGMYGKHIHQAVIANKDAQTGATTHFVNNKYDDGKIIHQQSLPVTSDDTAETIEQKVKILEKTLLIKTINELI